MNKEIETKHIPIPWHIEKPFGESGIYISSKSTALICKMYETDKVEHNRGCPIDEEANANRIVDCVNSCEGINPKAVPELLEALKRLVRVASVELANSRTDVIEQANEAIAEAERTE